MQITTSQLHAGYASTPILHGVDVTIPPNAITALIGPNGCGKSTLLKTIAGLLSPSEGKVLLNQDDIRHIKPNDFAKKLALLPQSQTPPDGISVKEAVAYGRTPYTGFWGALKKDDWNIVERAMVATGIDHLASRYVTDLSGGQCQRVWLALTLAQDSHIILLDEPTTYLDLNHQVELMKLMARLRDKEKTVITVLHDLNQACRYCDHLIVMKAGHIVAQGSPDAVVTSSMLAEVFDLDAEIHRDPIAGTPMCIVR